MKCDQGLKVFHCGLIDRFRKYEARFPKVICTLLPIKNTITDHLLVLKLLRLDPVSEGVTAIGMTPLAWEGDKTLIGLFFGLAMG